MTSGKSPKILYDSQAVRKMFPRDGDGSENPCEAFERDPGPALAWKSQRGESEGRRVAAAAACHLVLTWRHCMFRFPSPRCMEGRFIKCMEYQL